MKRISKDDAIFFMSRENEPALRVTSGETVVFEMWDCFHGQLVSEDQDLRAIDRTLLNPATGPLFIEGAEPGDVLKIEILGITTAESGALVTLAGEDVLGEFFSEDRSRIVPIRNGKALFSPRVQIPIQPMIGVIGVAPAGEPSRTVIPDSHGGNMDCRRIARESVLYLPVNVPGALLAMGDLHGIQGDGEAGGSGLEVSGEVTVRVHVVKNAKLPTPMLVEGNDVMTLVSAKTLDEAAKLATAAMHGFLTSELDIETHEAAMLISMMGNLNICQMVDPLMTVRMEIPLALLEDYRYRMP
jgi:amidase